MIEVQAIEKVLSTNDIGINGTHQGGMLIPKRNDILAFFPSLDKNANNPRSVILITDESVQKWKFNFIYYNNKFRGGTRNEYRLTGMTKFFRGGNLKVGDSIILRQANDEYLIQYRRKDVPVTECQNAVIKLELSNEWRIIKF